MGTTVTTTDRVKKRRIGLGAPPPPPGRNGPRGNGSGGNGRERKDEAGPQFSPKPYRLTLWILLAAIVMMFTALVASYVMLSAGDKWQPLATPRLLWLSTGIIITSSLTLERARSSLKQGRDKAYGRWLIVTLLFGLGFLVSQILAWRQLVAQRIYLASNNHSSFFYLLTGAHGLHLLGGILGLVYLIWRTRREGTKANAEMKRRAAAGVVSVYWHFMDGLWVFLFLLLFLWK